MPGLASVSSVPADKFTDEMLAKNFVAIAQAFQDTDRWIKHLEGHVTELYQMAEAAAKVKVKTPSRLKPFVVGTVVGVAAYRYVTKNRAKVDEYFVSVSEEAKASASEVADRVREGVEKMQANARNGAGSSAG